VCHHRRFVLESLPPAFKVPRYCDVGNVAASMKCRPAKGCIESREFRRSGPHSTRDMAMAVDQELDHLGLRVLLIEDSIDTLHMLKLWLNAFGCEVFIAADAKEGMTLATRVKPELIISDIGMPDMDGYQLMRNLRKTTGLERVPAIALSGYDHPDDKELANAAGFNAHLTKPTDMRRLHSLIKKLTTNH